MTETYRERFIRQKVWTSTKGHKKFKPMKQITNHILYGLMKVYDLKTIDIAKHTGVSQRSVQHWITDGAIPRNQETADKLAKLFKVPPHVLFFECRDKDKLDDTISKIFIWG